MDLIPTTDLAWTAAASWLAWALAAAMVTGACWALGRIIEAILTALDANDPAAAANSPAVAIRDQVDA